MGYTDIEFKFRKIGKNVQIGRHTYFRYPDEVEIGDNVIIDDFCYFTTRVKIGSYVHVSAHVSAIGGRKSELVLGDFSGVSAGCRIACSSDSYSGDGMTNPLVPEEFHCPVTYSTVTIGNHAIIGSGVVIHPGVTVGEGCAVGSLTLVNKDLEPWGMYVGIPARRTRERERETILRQEQELRRKIAEGLL